ncbi:uncharacterized skeletal organic matrix protein 5 [Nematostella vectensis]|uniref:uncharacterized skeletal organic matrix protein 5 n=1 Tax=Nematostella vectensis TaxID=45351 RepID=UPI0013902B21|nr:uncharacterized skeletal organic matrix protein 5 [Nematostella vectensis]XP_032231157.1 uncharacterized skeletal organic matrix protein 5 [Nematostella vectensis]XP_032231158.1 uncharacterized skeletal organic matrix protein 5 [Nematostella vectensis]XP_048589407.1 uncharacterized skeletal organic matrix protein 5 [Nematostella vectensis]XP_048589408.1 uncharacterized skeletal organic matrix protein 5 [Nematostella vectensis]
MSQFWLVAPFSTNSNKQREKDLVHRAFDSILKGSLPPDPCSNVTCKNGGTCNLACAENIEWLCACQPNTTGMLCEHFTGNASPSSCKEVYDRGLKKDAAYILSMENKSVEIYCHMTVIDGCGDGGWTLAMKVDGAKATFLYESSLWTNKLAYNPSAGLTGFDNQETKLPSYWATPFTKICIGLKVGDNLKSMTIPYTATSLYDVIADGIYRGTTPIGKTAWKALIAGSSMQADCNQEGFNVGGRVRVGLVSNEQNDCGSVDSMLGIGGNSWLCAAGNTCRYCCCDNGYPNIKAIGYLLLK